MDLLDGLLGGIDNIVGWIGDAIGNALGNFFGKILYYIVTAICSIVKVMYNFFTVFSGQRMVSYDGKQQYLINIFFGNPQVNNLYWGMAVIAMVFIIALTIIAVIRKSMDMQGKQQQSLGAILMNAFKSFLIILLLSAVMSAVINLTNVLVDRVTFLFNHAATLGDEKEMDFTDEQYATMARIYNTIGNYSLNTAYSSRYNLNNCYNEIRPDLLKLQEEGVFSFYYDDENGENKTWQSELQKLVQQQDPAYEIAIDDRTAIDTILLDIMKTLRTNKNFYPVSHIERGFVEGDEEDVSLDRVIFLLGTLGAAKNSRYNQQPSITDSLRGPFYYGEKSIYSYSDFSEAFEVDMGHMSYIMIGLLAFFTIKNLATCIFNCIGRIFTLLGLYIIAPPIAAVTPLDNGEKFKQWTTSTVVQMFSIFGCIIPMRLVIMFVPMVMDSRLELFDSLTMNLMGKGLLIVGAVEAANRFSSIVTGILANNAGYEAVRAGDMSGFAQKTFGKVGRAATAAVGAAANATGVGAAGRFIGGKLSDAWNYTSKKGGLVLGSIRGARALYRGTTEGQLKSRQEHVNRRQLVKAEKELGLRNNNGPYEEEFKKAKENQNKEIPPRE